MDLELGAFTVFGIIHGANYFERIIRNTMEICFRFFGFFRILIYDAYAE